MLVQRGFEPATSRSADQHSPNWANQATVSTLKKDCTSVLSDQMSKTSSIQTKQNKNTVNLIKRLMKAVSTHCKQVSYFPVIIWTINWPTRGLLLCIPVFKASHHAGISVFPVSFFLEYSMMLMQINASFVKYDLDDHKIGKFVGGNL